MELHDTRGLGQLVPNAPPPLWVALHSREKYIWRVILPRTSKCSHIRMTRRIRVLSAPMETRARTRNMQTENLGRPTYIFMSHVSRERRSLKRPLNVLATPTIFSRCFYTWLKFKRDVKNGHFSRSRPRFGSVDETKAVCHSSLQGASSLGHPTRSPSHSPTQDV